VKLYFQVFIDKKQHLSGVWPFIIGLREVFVANIMEGRGRSGHEVTEMQVPFM